MVQILKGAEAHVEDLRDPLGPERIGGGGGRRQDDKGEGHGEEHGGACGSLFWQILIVYLGNFNVVSILNSK